ncbi:hypothetical protein L6452_31949 [Arctium lappa]|uniref:Uncharacterized protein n=1 Tax=Arctium lappa TaxID=4217 RepID=A0ACB8Z7F0_ARCLA|nr:hypothetical protein L6452_31949 [Arctium lappa]
MQDIQCTFCLHASIIFEQRRIKLKTVESITVMPLWYNVTLERRNAMSCSIPLESITVMPRSKILLTIRT